jgi:two-component system cell cycle sensor histidine kinase/response regulator CckA
MSYACLDSARDAPDRIAPHGQQDCMKTKNSTGEPEGLSATQKLECMARLAGGVAHDFNNLLTVIVGGCELMAARDQRDEAPSNAGLVQMVRDAADRGVALTRQLLVFSRRQHLTPTSIDLNEAITAVCGALRGWIPDDIVIAAKVEKDAGCIGVDGGALELLLTNLALNARDAMPSGGTLTVAAGRCAISEPRAGLPDCVPAGSYVRCRIADTGCGMTEEVRRRLCEPFFTTKDAGKGAGLGLAAAYGIVKQSSGFIQVESHLGRGTAVLLYFSHASVQPQAIPAAAKPARRFRGNRTVLLVEDEDAVRAIASQSLARDQFTVLEARSGDEALRISRRWPQPIHIMVTDVMMPRMNGRQLAEQIAPERPEMRILLMSGYIDEAVMASKLPGPALPFLPKPFTSEGLVTKVRAVLH